MSATKAIVEITVRGHTGTYETNQVRKCKASCTAGPEQAARRLGEKLFGNALLRVEELAHPGPVGTTMWRLHVRDEVPQK